MIVTIYVPFTYRCFKPNFLKIGLVVYEKKLKMNNAWLETKMDSNRSTVWPNQPLYTNFMYEFICIQKQLSGNTNTYQYTECKGPSRRLELLQSTHTEAVVNKKIYYFNHFQYHSKPFDSQSAHAMKFIANRCWYNNGWSISFKADILEK